MASLRNRDRKLSAVSTAAYLPLILPSTKPMFSASSAWHLAVVNPNYWHGLKFCLFPGLLDCLLCYRLDFIFTLQYFCKNRTLFTNEIFFLYHPNWFSSHLCTKKFFKGIIIYKELEVSKTEHYVTKITLTFTYL